MTRAATTQKQQTPQQECAEMGAPVEAHERLKPFVGTFKSEVKMWMGPGEPHTSTGKMINELDLGGRFLRQTYRGDDSGGPFPNFEGRGFWGFNTVANKYEGFWIDSASTMMQTEQGGVDSSGKVWTMFGEFDNPQTGKPMKKKSVITLHDDNGHSLEMYFQGPDGEYAKAMEITYYRVK